MDRYIFVRSTEVSSGPPGAHPYYAMQGRFDADEAGEGLQDCDQCPPAEHEDYADWRTYGWEFGERLGPPGFAPDGGPMHVAIREGYVLRTTEAGRLHTMIDARESGPSLADDEVWQLLAREFDRLDIVEGEMTSHTFDLAEAAARWEEMESMSEPGSDDWLFPDRGIPVLRPYLAIGAGLGVEDGESTAFQILVHETPELAAENLELAQARLDLWLEADLYPGLLDGWFDRAEVEQDGRVVTVKFIGAFSYMPVFIGIFLHE